MASPFFLHREDAWGYIQRDGGTVEFYLGKNRARWRMGPEGAQRWVHGAWQTDFLIK